MRRISILAGGVIVLLIGLVIYSREFNYQRRLLAGDQSIHLTQVVFEHSQRKGVLKDKQGVAYFVERMGQNQIVPFGQHGESGASSTFTLYTENGKSWGGGYLNSKGLAIFVNEDLANLFRENPLELERFYVIRFDERMPEPMRKCIEYVVDESHPAGERVF